MKQIKYNYTIIISLNNHNLSSLHPMLIIVTYSEWGPRKNSTRQYLQLIFSKWSDFDEITHCGFLSKMVKNCPMILLHHLKRAHFKLPNPNKKFYNRILLTKFMAVQRSPVPQCGSKIPSTLGMHTYIVYREKSWSLTNLLV